MSDLLAIAASGVRAYQTALSVVGDNIANTGVTGYSRRSVALAENAGGVGLTASTLNAGNGVTVTGVARSADAYATAAVRGATTDLSRTQGASSWLSRIEGALTGNDLSSRITGFYAAGEALSADASSTGLRTAMLGQATSVAVAYTATGKAFDQIDADLNQAGQDAASTLTSLGASLARVNDGLSRTPASTSAAAQLADQRDQLLSQMSALTDITSTTDQLGRATVKLGGANGPTFVSMTNSGAVSYSRDAADTVSFTLHYLATSTQITSQGGGMAGLADGVQRVADARAQLDTLATSFVSSVNTVQTGGEDVKGVAGKPLFTVGSEPTAISLALSSGDQIAAAAVGGGSRDGSNLDKLRAARATAGIESATASLVTNNADAITQKQTIADAQTAILSGANGALTSATGVNLDSEAVDLMRFQQAYAASSRVVQVARDTFQSILEIR